MPVSSLLGIILSPTLPTSRKVDFCFAVMFAVPSSSRSKSPISMNRFLKNLVGDEKVEAMSLINFIGMQQVFSEGADGLDGQAPTLAHLRKLIVDYPAKVPSHRGSFRQNSFRHGSFRTRGSFRKHIVADVVAADESGFGVAIPGSDDEKGPGTFAPSPLSVEPMSATSNQDDRPAQTTALDTVVSAYVMDHLQRAARDSGTLTESMRSDPMSELSVDSANDKKMVLAGVPFGPSF